MACAHDIADCGGGWERDHDFWTEGVPCLVVDFKEGRLTEVCEEWWQRTRTATIVNCATDILKICTGGQTQTNLCLRESKSQWDAQCVDVAAAFGFRGQIDRSSRPMAVTAQDDHGDREILITIGVVWILLAFGALVARYFEFIKAFTLQGLPPESHENRREAGKTIELTSA